MRLVITIDTEEDNWGSYSPTVYTVENIRRIPSLQCLFDEFKAVPTYLLTYSVATDKEAISILREIRERGRCEIGTHCHPWNTPPFDEENTPRNSMLRNLSGDLQFKKILCLHEAIETNFNTRPTSFRAGRWAYNKEVPICLERLGYKVDSSITPFMDWSRSEGPDFSSVSLEPFYIDPQNVFQHSSNGEILEVPATIGFLQRNFKLSNRLFNLLRREPMSRLRLIGVLDRLHLLNKTYLSPEKCNGAEMIAFARSLIKKRVPILNLFFHSSTLEPGKTPFVRNEADRQEFISRIRMFLEFAEEAGIESIRLSDAVEVIKAC